MAIDLHEIIAQQHKEVDDCCLEGMIVHMDGFFEEKEDGDHHSTKICSTVEEEEEDHNKVLISSNEITKEMLKGLLCINDALHVSICRDVEAALTCLRTTQEKGEMRRLVMKSLQSMGYNAGICKSKWGHISGGIPSGEYEYIDVILFGDVRYVVEIHFKEQFEIARATPEYREVFELLPNVFVGRENSMKKIIKLVCNFSKESLKKNKMHVAPWRKHKYMQNKWFGSYTRSATATQFSAPSSLPQLHRNETCELPVQRSSDKEFKSQALNSKDSSLRYANNIEWTPQKVGPKSKLTHCHNGKILGGLASAFIEKQRRLSLA